MSEHVVTGKKRVPVDNTSNDEDTRRPAGSPTGRRLFRTEMPNIDGGKQQQDMRYSLQATGDAAKNWDYLANRPPGKRTTVLESVGHLVKSCLGGGIVSIHEAYKDCGLWTATVLNVLLGFMVSYAMIMLAQSAQKCYGRTQVPQMSYPDLAEASLCIGPWPKMRKYSRFFRYMIDATIMIDLFGSCCCYQVIIARTIKQLVEMVDDVQSEADPTKNSPNIRFYILFLLIPCVLLCMIRTLKYLAPFSLVADAIIITVAIATVAYGTSNANNAGRSPGDMPAFTDIPNLFGFMGVCVFSMEGVGVTLCIENAMQEPKKIVKVLVIGMTIVASMVMIVGFFGYWGFGHKAKAPVTLNFPFNIFTNFLKGSMAVMVYVTFALNFWVPFELAWHYLKRRHVPEKHWYIERIYRAIFVIVITGIAIAFPEVSKLIGVIGAFCLSNMGFIYPAFIELILDWTDPGLGAMKWRLWKFIYFLVFGLVLMCVGTVLGVKELYKAIYGKTDNKTATTPAPEAY